MKAVSFLNNVRSGSDLVNKSSENHEGYVTTPNNRLTSSLFVGAGIDLIQSCFLVSGLTLLSVRTTPM